MTAFSSTPGANQGVKTGADSKLAKGFIPVPGWNDLSDGATIEIDASLGPFHRVTLGGNRTIAAPTNAVDSQGLAIAIIQDATGGRTVTWNAAFAFSNDSPEPTLSTGGNDLDLISFVYEDTIGKWLCTGYNRGY